MRSDRARIPFGEQVHDIHSRHHAPSPFIHSIPNERLRARDGQVFNRSDSATRSIKYA